MNPTASDAVEVKVVPLWVKGISKALESVNPAKNTMLVIAETLMRNSPNNRPAEASQFNSVAN